MRLSRLSSISASQGKAFFHPDEAALLRAFIADIRKSYPDVLTGLNALDFDCKCLWERCAWHGILFSLERSKNLESVYLSGEGRSSATALVPGRQVLDALRLVRSGPKEQGVHFADYTLETASQVLLGKGKLLTHEGSERIAPVYPGSPRFGVYGYQEAVLVLHILKQTGLFRLTVESACLTGVTLDKTWTSVASFERLYGVERLKRGIAVPQAAY
ncbi:MAG: hypothetical protein LBC51_04515 [Treponema sp.]|jgi:DNA polymerase-2|nr:hypothetical protein [Treponema sp.]